MPKSFYYYEQDVKFLFYQKLGIQKVSTKIDQQLFGTRFNKFKQELAKESGKLPTVYSYETVQRFLREVNNPFAKSETEYEDGSASSDDDFIDYSSRLKVGNR